MTTKQVSFLFEDNGFCKDVFCTIQKPKRYYNRDTENGIWYSSEPGYFENDTPIRKDVIFEIISNGEVCALDSNGEFEGKKPFVPFYQFRKSLMQSFQAQHPHLKQYEEMKEKLFSLPGGEKYSKCSHGWENWAFALDFENPTEEIAGSAQWLNLRFHILAVRYTHKPTGFSYINYRFRSDKHEPNSASMDLLLYEW